MNFAIRIVNLYNFLNETKQERIMSKQILRSGTSVGANIREGQFAESPADFIHKYSVAQKECSETLYWLELLNKTNYITTEPVSYTHLGSVIQPGVTSSSRSRIVPPPMAVTKPTT